jgi:hypothetical protein
MRQTVNTLLLRCCCWPALQLRMLLNLLDTPLLPLLLLLLSWVKPRWLGQQTCQYSEISSRNSLSDGSGVRMPSVLPCVQHAVAAAG